MGGPRINKIMCPPFEGALGLATEAPRRTTLYMRINHASLSPPVVLPIGKREGCVESVIRSVINVRGRRKDRNEITLHTAFTYCTVPYE